MITNKCDGFSGVPRLKVLDVRHLRVCAATTSLRPLPIGTGKFLHSGFGFYPISTGKFYYGYTGCEKLSKPIVFHMVAYFCHEIAR